MNGWIGSVRSLVDSANGDGASGQQAASINGSLLSTENKEVMKKLFFRALIVGLIFVFVYYAFQIIQGMYLTMNYVPDIVEKYESVDYLQYKVTFGHVSNPLWRTIEVSGLMLLGIVVYYTGRILRRKK